MNNTGASATDCSCYLSKRPTCLPLANIVKVKAESCDIHLLSSLFCFPLPGGGESLILSFFSFCPPSSGVPAALYCIAVILCWASEQTPGSTPRFTLRKKGRVKEEGHQSQGLLVIVSMYTQGNNTAWTPGLQQGKVEVMCHPAVVCAVQTTL